MKGPILTLIFYTHILFLQALGALGPRARRHGSRHHSLSFISSHGMEHSRSLLAHAPSPHHSYKRASSIEIIRERRIGSIINGLSDRDVVIPAWLSSLGPDGKWPDSEVDYTTGCAARLANWPAQIHWVRIMTMSAAWYGGVPGADAYVNDEALRAAISRAMDYWFKRDFTNMACLGSGGKGKCPCNNPEKTLWNKNWYSNVILIPRMVGQTCLLLRDTLTSAQEDFCIRMTSRSYTYNKNSLTGANTLDVCRIAIDQALLTSNSDLLSDAYRRSHGEVVIMNGIRTDGIRADGAFGQHDGMLYNGNYGKDYANDILGIELEAAGTEFSANEDSQAAFGTLFDGDRWMIFRNSLTGKLYWDFSVLGRFISFPVADAQATGGLGMSLASVGTLGRNWKSAPLIDFESSLSEDTPHANAGNLRGNRMFYTNDYMVHRGTNYVSTVKMWSSRTKHTECINLENPLGFHLASGVSYNYIRGNEYEDIAAAWDWNLIPGITVDYGATPLNCKNTKLFGLEGFVGGASDGRIGIAAMRYTNPATRALRWQKAWFFLEEDIQHVMISGLSSASGAPVYSVLDQRRREGPIYVDGSEQQTPDYSAARTMWHGGVGYKFSGDGLPLRVQAKQQTGDWSTIGISTQSAADVDMFTAWIPHQSLDDPISYSVFPGIDADSFATRSEQVQFRTIQSDVHISSIFDDAQQIFMAAFWDGSGGSVTFRLAPAYGSITISANVNVAVLYRLETGDVTVSDPSQSLSTAQLILTREQGRNIPNWSGGETKTMDFVLPRDGLAGSSVTQNTQT